MSAGTPSAGWLRSLHQWHWISSAVCLVGLLLFALTGITLNHASEIESAPTVRSRTLQLPQALLASLPAASANQRAPLPEPLRLALQHALLFPISAAPAEWSEQEIYLALPRAGGDAWLRLDRATGELEFEDSDRGWLALLNDLHKGRHTGTAWRWFIDGFALSCLLFAITGLLILKHHALRRPGTWPLVGLGLLLPALLVLLLVH